MNTLPVLPKKIFIEATYAACNRRKLDAQKLRRYFEVNDYSVVSTPDNADVILLVTCAVSLSRENDSMRRVCDLKKFHGELIVCGCLPGINSQRLDSVHHGKSIATSQLFTIDDYFPEMRIKFAEIQDANRYYPANKNVLNSDFFRSLPNKWQALRMLSPQYIVKKKIPKFLRNLTASENIAVDPFPIRISWGCDSKCSYCGIRSAVGRFRSKPLETCKNEFLEGLQKGFKKFEIIADNVGAYGIDIGKTFPDLINLLLDVEGDYGIRIWNLSPLSLVKDSDDFVAIFQKKKISEIHCPVQSGSDRILKAMNRYSNVSKIEAAFALLKTYSPDLYLTTDIILGFPGETEADVDQTIELIRQANFKAVDIFIYNDVRNTAAFNLPDKVSRKVVEQRVRRVAKALEKMDLEYQIA